MTLETDQSRHGTHHTEYSTPMGPFRRSIRDTLIHERSCCVLARADVRGIGSSVMRMSVSQQEKVTYEEYVRVLLSEFQTPACIIVGSFSPVP